MTVDAALARAIDDAEAAAALGHAARAEGIYRAALARWPEHPAIWFNLGNLQAARADHAGAADSFARVCRLAPRFAAGQHNLGNALAGLQRGSEAAAAYRAALALDADLVASRVALSQLQVAAHEPAAAALLLEQGLARSPNCVPLLIELGSVRDALGEPARAVALYRRAVALEPESAAAVHNLSAALQAVGAPDAALALALKAVQLDPALPQAHENLGNILSYAGDIEQARTVFATASRLKASKGGKAGTDLGIELRSALQLPPVPASKLAIAEARERFERGIEAQLLNQGHLGDPIREVGVVNHFYLAYHGLPNREMLTRLASMYRQLCPALAYTARHGHGNSPRRSARIRVGLVSRYLCDHTVGRFLLGIVQHLSRLEFELCLFTWGRADDETARAFAAAADELHVLPLALQPSQQAVAEARLDVLLFGDIGMEPASYFLAFSRLAPVQCSFFGHPDTTGLDTIDHYLSWAPAETAASAGWYREPLALLPAQATYACIAAPPVPPRRPTRTEAGLPEGGRIYLCVQAPHKIHPDFDDMVAVILQVDEAATVVFVQKAVSAWNRALQARLARRLGGNSHRLRFLPERSYPDYLRLLGAADVVLDTPHFCGGATSLDTLAVGTPVVTLRGTVLRANQTAAMLQRIGIEELTASDPGSFVQRAVALARDTERQHSLRRCLAERTPALFGDTGMVRALEAMLKNWAG